ncbi:MAG TPA: response regulator [Gemmatimonadales bacterium]|nr:response regulator [Gemmatimonadales bacterium]
MESSDYGLPIVVLTVLVVDDRSMARRIASRILSEEGFRVLEADGMGEALEVLAQARGRVDLVMLDVVLADGDGVKLARQIQEEWPSQRILFMSGFAAEVLTRYGLRDLDVPFLAKPFTRGELLAKVAEAIDRPTAQTSRTRPATDREQQSEPEQDKTPGAGQE